MIGRASAPRWAISFADLALLLLGCFVVLHALQPAAAPPELAAEPAPAGTELIAAELFEPGEARLSAAGEVRIAALAAAARGRAVIVSRGSDAGGNRLDGFELAAARAAALGRSLGLGDEAVSVTVEPAAAAMPGQRLYLQFPE